MEALELNCRYASFNLAEWKIGTFKVSIPGIEGSHGFGACPVARINFEQVIRLSDALLMLVSSRVHALSFSPSVFVRQNVYERYSE